MVSLNTHSVDLDKYPLNFYSRLLDKNGSPISNMSEWEVVNGAGHHIVGKLNFPADGRNWQTLEGLKLVIENYGGAALRELVWEKLN